MIFAAVALSAAIAEATPPTGCDARSILRQVRAATGGHRWDGVAEIVAIGVIDDAGSDGTYRRAHDVKTGRSAFSESLGVGRVAYVYDGTTQWEIDQGGGVHALDAPDTAARAVTRSVIESAAVWSDDNATTCVRTETQGGTAFDVLRVSPPRGNPAELWIDRSTHLIDREVDPWPTTQLTERYTDYRHMNGLLLPYRVTRTYDDQNGAPARTVEIVRAYRVLAKARTADFVRPADPPAGRLIGPDDSVPIAVDHGVTIFSATIDGKGPFAFTFDPGAQGALTTVAANPLGRTVGEMTHVESIQLGKAAIDGVDLPVYAGSPTDLFPQRTAGLSPIAGSLGPELLDRFALRLDYSKNTMTLAPPGTLACGGDAQRFVLQEDDDIPLVHASIDGHDGLFQFDLRAPASLIVFKPFADRTGLQPSDSVASMSIAGGVLRDVPARFLSAVSGKFASRTEAGLIGSALISRFVTTIDYRTRTICFVPRA